MNAILKQAFDAEMLQARVLYAQAEYRAAFGHRERAHVLGQRNAWPHTVNHFWMLKVGWRQHDRREILGQLTRLAMAGIGSLLGRGPVGNTGGANVGILTPMTIAEDLVAVFRAAGVSVSPGKK